MKMRLKLFVFALLFTGFATSCTPDDQTQSDEQQISATDNSDSTPEHEGDDEELEPND